MKPGTTTLPRMRKLHDEQLTIGLDLGDRSSFYCVLNEAAEVMAGVTQSSSSRPWVRR